MKYFVIFLVFIGFVGYAFATHDPTQPYVHSIVLPTDMKYKTFEEFMEWCKPYYGEKCTELYEQNHLSNVLSPLKQFKSGISIDQIQCKDEFVVAIKASNGNPNCVKRESLEILRERGWAEPLGDIVFQKPGNSNVPIIPDVGKTGIYKLAFEDKEFDIAYSIKGAGIENMVFSNDTNSLTLVLDAVHQGSLDITIPRDLIDAKMDYCPPLNPEALDDRFFVLLDGEEILYEEILTTSEKRTLHIPFLENTKKMEIIATCLI